MYFAKFCILQFYPELRKFTAAYNIMQYHYNTKASQNPAARTIYRKSCNLWKFFSCVGTKAPPAAIFTTFVRSLLFISWKIFGDFIQLLMILNGINMIPLFLKKSSIQSLFFLKLYFAKFRILQLFLDTWFSSIRRTLDNFTGRIFKI